MQNAKFNNKTTRTHCPISFNPWTDDPINYSQCNCMRKCSASQDKKYFNCSLNSNSLQPISNSTVNSNRLHSHIQHAKRCCRDAANNHQDSNTTVCNQVPMWTETHLIRLPEFIFKNDCYWALAHNYKSLFMPYIFRRTSYDIVVLCYVSLCIRMRGNGFWCWL